MWVTSKQLPSWVSLLKVSLFSEIHLLLAPSKTFALNKHQRLVRHWIGSVLSMENITLDGKWKSTISKRFGDHTALQLIVFMRESWEDKVQLEVFLRGDYLSYFSRASDQVPNQQVIGICKSSASDVPVSTGTVWAIACLRVAPRINWWPDPGSNPGVGKPVDQWGHSGF